MVSTGGIPGERYNLELAAVPSPDLNAAFQEFIKPATVRESRAMSIGRSTLEHISLASFQVAPFEVPRQLDRGFYGEGEGLALGVYTHSLSKIAKNELKVDEAHSASGIDINRRGDARIWLTLDPSPGEREKIVAPPMYAEGETQPDLRMYFTINHELFIGRSEARLAMNSLLKVMRQEEARRQEILTLQNAAFKIAEFNGKTAMNAPKLTPRGLYLNQLRIRRSPRQLVPPATESEAQARNLRRAA